MPEQLSRAIAGVSLYASILNDLDPDTFLSRFFAPFAISSANCNR